MVVMNHGLIEQSGSPHTVYNKPLNEFVARFMGGHNVIETPAGKIGVRTDQTRIAREGAPEIVGLPSIGAIVTDVEYQGTYVLLGLQNPAAKHAVVSSAEYSVMLSESQFSATPFAVGDAVQLAWTPDSAHALQT
jgi:putative spermidine/putrescine transport system ATP-binding protein